MKKCFEGLCTALKYCCKVINRLKNVLLRTIEKPVARVTSVDNRVLEIMMSNCNIQNCLLIEICCWPKYKLLAEVWYLYQVKCHESLPRSTTDCCELSNVSCLWWSSTVKQRPFIRDLPVSRNTYHEYRLGGWNMIPPPSTIMLPSKALCCTWYCGHSSDKPWYYWTPTAKERSSPGEVFASRNSMSFSQSNYSNHCALCSVLVYQVCCKSLLRMNTDWIIIQYSTMITTCRTKAIATKKP